ncbi:MAG: hypothetical protein LPK21_08760, partial [Hymenobacteraceae bacterium]|nr:hypothetical protein [Hymenobacteraceae bacterium]
MTLKIPVKPHVSKYLQKKYGADYKLNKRDAISITLYNMLRRPSTDARLSSRTKRCTAVFEVNLSAFAFFKKGCRNLDAYTIIQFNSYVEDCIDTEFFSYVENLESLGLQQKEAIAHFMLKYEFDETDVKYDTLKKAYQRYRI